MSDRVMATKPTDVAISEENPTPAGGAEFDESDIVDMSEGQSGGIYMLRKSKPNKARRKLGAKGNDIENSRAPCNFHYKGLSGNLDGVPRIMSTSRNASP